MELALKKVHDSLREYTRSDSIRSHR